MNPDEDSVSASESGASFAEILSQFEESHRGGASKPAEGREGVVVAVSGEFVFVDVGLKTEGVIPIADLKGAAPPARGEKVQVSIAGRNPEGYYLLSTIRVARPRDWSALEKASEEKRTIAGVVTGLVKGGLTVDVGVRAFLPASRSGTRDAAELEQLVGQEIACKIIKLDVADEDVVVDRRAVLEEEEKVARGRLFSELKEGTVLRGSVRTLADYGAFIDLGGVDGLLHVADMSWGRVAKPADVLSVGDSVEVQVLKVDAARQRISLGMKQLQTDPWSEAAGKYASGARVRGVVTRVTDFGAFVELEPGLEGLVHLSEMSWTRKVRKPSDVLKPGDAVEAIVLGVNPADRRLSLGLKQALGDPWETVEERFPAGAVVEGGVTSLAKFGAFVDLGDGIEGMIHIGDLSGDKRLNHPQEVLKAGQMVRAVVVSIDREKRRIRLGVKQLQPTSVDEYIAEHKEGDVVTGRIARVSDRAVTVELGDGIQASCSLPGETAKSGESTFWDAPAAAADVSTLSSMLAAKWKTGAVRSAPPRREPAHSGQIRSFRIVRMDVAAKKIELELAG
ncbi:MAG: 30S ribosomal protein S1 [Bryobacteraceae bacterium]